MLLCPGCELSGEELIVVEVSHVYSTRTAAGELVRLDHDDSVHWVETGEVDDEVLDTDDHELRCEGCGYQTDDPADFLADDDEDQDD
jgi:hypothetical protein